MTRTHHHPGAHHPGARPPGARPPGRRDTRRPAGAPPRTPDGGAPRTAPPRAPVAGHRPPVAPVAPVPSVPPVRPVPSTSGSPAVPARAPRRPLTQPRPTDLFADRLLAVLTGRRPVHFMLRHTLGRAYDDLAHLAERGPLRTSHGARAVVRDIGYYVPRPGAIEAFARIGAGDRLRAMAFRLELGTDRRWRCTAVELDGPRRPAARDD
ncbi:Rv3235 family protein [Streptomyces sp. NBC_00199]|uniref:Rv3235 family protein n=1 Tax=Streptomyces sp. NBC_00199 TaxID=2975678 RepID=UPI00224DD642|nr:Rv3235 family protein [Streptomyces sp. NBC_00199]MCX5263854.1 Rv3235 family protein [Streptomyces sp. NBC_00199]